ncbi:MAG: ribulose-phosphate 3-epimerase [Acidimicrobiales bacterium]
MSLVAPSILSADFAALAAAIDGVAAEADLLHVDVMDGHFVPNLTIGPPVVAAINRHTELALDCHLMMTNPGDYLEAFRDAGADWVSVHVEVGDTADLIAEMRKLGVKIGLALNPETAFEEVEPWLAELDHVLVMTVHPGFGGQRFMHEVVPKLARIASTIRDRGLRALVEVDGGIDRSTVGVVATAGAGVLVAGNAIFGSDDPAGAVVELRRLAQPARG